jgi:transcriptional regulator with XRE-family HTH domain
MKRRGDTLAELAEILHVDINTVWRWKAEKNLPTLEIQRQLCERYGCTLDELLNGPEKKEIEIRILIRESDEEVGKVTMDMSKDAPFLQLVEIAPYKTGLNLVFGPEKSLRDVCNELLASEEKIESARSAVYGA